MRRTAAATQRVSRRRPASAASPGRRLHRIAPQRRQSPRRSFHVIGHRPDFVGRGSRASQI
jgi:hypothetical protein